jgi:transposase
MASFACGIAQDYAAVKAALTEPWSNGQTEGQNTKLKRQMYEGANLDLLRARLIAAASAPRLRQSPFPTPKHSH